jgi:ribosomal protein S18 acetylase RimI-like enzyme
MVRFEPMTEAEFAAYCESSIASYAAEHVRAGTYPEEGSVEKARSEFHKLLPQGIHTPGQTLVWLVDEPSGERVGHLWWAERASDWFIYDVEIREAFRRRGYAQQAFEELERRARAGGAPSVGLHVFGTNSGAITLYEKLGFETTHRMMAKKLSKTA